MERFLIESPHELTECASILHEVAASGYLNNFDWGCHAGVHTGWAIIEAEDERQAQLAVPPLMRRRAHIIKLNKFSAEEVEKLHP